MYLVNFTNKNISGAQERDYFFKSGYAFLKCERFPKDQAMINKLKTRHQDYIISYGLLWHVSKHIQNSDSYQQIFIPTEFRLEIM